MEIVRNLVLLLHLLGFAALAGGALVQVASTAPVLTRFIKDGAYTQFLTGLILVGLLEMGVDPVNHAKVAVKLLVVVGIIVLVLVNRKKPSVTPGTLRAILGLTVLNAAVAVLWT